MRVIDLQKRCEHGFFHAHCDEHPGKQSHFGVATHEGGCHGPSAPTTEDLVAALVAKEAGEIVMRCTVHGCDYEDGAPGCGVWIAVKRGGGRPEWCLINQFSEHYVVALKEE